MTKNFSETYQTADGEITVDVNYGEYDGDIRQSIVGSDDADTLEAHGFLSTIDGRDGDDLILVDATRANEMILIGGGGRDTFAFLPGDHTISATIKDFNLDEDTMVLVTLTADGELAVLAAVGDNAIEINEEAYLAAEEAAASVASTSNNTFRYDPDTKVAALNLSDRGLNLRFENLDNGDRLYDTPVRVIDNDGNVLRNTKAGRKFLSDDRLSIYYNYENGAVNGDWLFVSSDYDKNIVLGGVDWNGNTVEGYSNASITAIFDSNGTVGGKILAGNDNTNYIYGGDGGNTLWGGPTNNPTQTFGSIDDSNRLFGGDGADTFIAATREYQNSSAMYRVDENDIVFMGNLSSKDIFSDVDAGIVKNSVYLDGITSDRYYWDYDLEIVRWGGSPARMLLFESNINGTQLAVIRDQNAWTITVELEDGYQLKYDYLFNNWTVQREEGWRPLALDTGALSLVDVDGKSALKVSTLYQGNVWLSRANIFNGVEIIDASEDVVQYRALVGNDLDNSIVAGVRSTSSIWGGTGGNDTLVGGGGSDTFFAGRGEGRTSILNSGDDDIIMLWNIAANDFMSLAPTLTTNDEGISLSMNDGDAIEVHRAEGASTTTFRLADYTKWQYNYADQTWEYSEPDRSGYEDRDGLIMANDNITVTSDFDGDIVLGGVDWNGNAVDGWINESIIDVNAESDTVAGRLLMGNDHENYIFAGSGGATLWGGPNGYNYLNGGDGEDVFVSGTIEGYFGGSMHHVEDKDLVYLYNVMPEDILSENISHYDDENVINLRFQDPRYSWSTNGISIWYDTDTASTTTVMFADGSTKVYTHLVEGTPNGLKNYDGAIYVSSEYVGNVALGGVDWNGNAIDGYAADSISTIDARKDTTSGRLLAGDENDNTIRAGSGGASLWGGNGGMNYLYGGAGADTFIAGDGDGTVDIYPFDDDDDIIFLDRQDIAAIGLGGSFGDQYIMIRTSGGSIIVINHDDAKKTTIQFADGETRTYDHDTESWLSLFYDDDDFTDGLMTIGSAVYLTSKYEGNFYLGDVDPYGNVVEGWSGPTLSSIDDRGDTVGGRLLAGDDRSNRIYAGSSGASLWGGGMAYYDSYFGGIGFDYLYGGTGADTFIVDAGAGNVSINNFNEEDVIVFSNITPDDIILNIGMYDLEYGILNLKTTDGTRIEINYADEELKTTTFKYSNGETRVVDFNDSDWRDAFVENDANLPDGLKKIAGMIYVSSEYVGDVYLDELSITTPADIGARGDTVSGRMLAGNAQDNEIYAGSGGVSMWGGDGGSDNLFGGDGADTFIAGAGEGDVYMYDVADDDVVVLKGITVADVANVSLEPYSLGAKYIDLILNDGTKINIRCQTETTTHTTIIYGDGEMRTFDYASGSVYDLIRDANLSEGLTTLDSTVMVSSSYVGDVVLGGVDWNGDSIDGWSDDSIININASNDTVGGRLLIGSALGNEIRAGSGGASIWGGGGGSDWLYGGSGGDTFIVGKDEGNNYIYDCADDDRVVLHNINASDISYESISRSGANNILVLTLLDDNYNSTFIDVHYDTDTTSTTTLEYADGSTKVYNHRGVSPADGLTNYDSNIHVSSSYVGDVVLGGVDWNGNSVGTWSDTSIININAENDTVGGRLLIGNNQSNYIYAGAGGDTLWGSGGNYGYASDYLYGGDGADVFVAGAGEGWIRINDCADDDLILLHNINLGDITWELDDSYTYSGYLEATPEGGSSIRIKYDKSTTTTTTVEYADGTRQRFDHASGTWATV